MPGGIDENGAHSIAPDGSRIQATLTDITIQIPEIKIRVEEHNPEGLDLSRDNAGLPDTSLLLNLSALFRGNRVIVDHRTEGNSTSSSHERQK